VHPSDIEKMAVITPFGLYQYVRMPFGLRNAEQTFQRLMDQVLRGLDYCFMYLDDVLVASSTMDEHMEHLEAVFSRLRQAGLLLNREKCVFGQPVVEYLGHRVSAAGVAPLQSKVQAVEQFPRPQSIKQLMTFLGMLNFYRRFLPQAAKVLKPLTDCLKGATAATRGSPLLRPPNSCWEGPPAWPTRTRRRSWQWRWMPQIHTPVLCCSKVPREGSSRWRSSPKS
jgi:Reverse transcriptase (RNA-dependent DNA polymerase)